MFIPYGTANTYLREGGARAFTDAEGRATLQLTFEGPKRQDAVGSLFFVSLGGYSPTTGFEYIAEDVSLWCRLLSSLQPMNSALTTPELLPMFSGIFSGRIH